MAEQTDWGEEQLIIMNREDIESLSPFNPLYLVFSSVHSHHKHQLGHKQVGTQYHRNVVVHVPKGPVKIEKFEGLVGPVVREEM